MAYVADRGHEAGQGKSEAVASRFAQDERIKCESFPVAVDPVQEPLIGLFVAYHSLRTKRCLEQRD